MHSPFRVVVLALAAAAGLVQACGGPEPKGAGPGDAAAARDGSARACTVEQAIHTPHADNQHVASAASETYNSNPPSSGRHCGTTASYGNHTAPVNRCNWLHNLEHGAVALLYDCPSGCPELVSQLQEILAEAPMDPDCRVRRVLVTPYGGLPTRVAAAAWGRTWTASCIDPAARASLLEFIGSNLGTRGIAPEASVCF